MDLPLLHDHGSLFYHSCLKPYSMLFIECPCIVGDRHRRRLVPTSCHTGTTTRRLDNPKGVQFGLDGLWEHTSGLWSLLASPLPIHYHPQQAAPPEVTGESLRSRSYSSFGCGWKFPKRPRKAGGGPLTRTFAGSKLLLISPLCVL